MVKNERTAPRPSAKREAILDAAQACFLEQGYAATSMDAVASGATVSKATIYAHFASKDALFAAVICRRCDNSSYTTGWPDGSGEAREALLAAGTVLMTLLLAPETMAMYRVVVAEAVRQPDLARAFWEEGPGRGKERLTALFAGLAERGVLRVADPWVAADQFAGMLRAEVFHRLLLGLPLPDGRTIETTVAAAVETLLRAYS
ncbi:MAG: TetR/AcrR family transcriptional regulator [Magnetospirillum sp.]|nr:TetR/AcrR family transcriptional regulator [Magnetospirillum sp.]